MRVNATLNLCSVAEIGGGGCNKNLLLFLSMYTTYLGMMEILEIHI